MAEQDRLREAKLDQLRQDVQAGLAIGPATAWDPAEVKREGRARKAAAVRTQKA